MRATTMLAAIAVLLFGAGIAQAHRLNMFAYVDGTTIVGSAYFSGGGVPVGVDVIALDPDGREIGRDTTDGDGAFAIEAAARVDHRLTIETVDGHAAEFTVAAADLPASLPLPDGAVEAGPVPVNGASADQAAPDGGGQSAAVIDQAALEAVVTRAVGQQVRPLREELLAYGEAVRLRDIVGGIGYILGLFGIAAYAMSLRRRTADDREHIARQAAAG